MYPLSWDNSEERKNRMTDSLTNHISLATTTNCFLSLSSQEVDTISDARRARDSKVRRAYALWPTVPWPHLREGRRRSLKRKDDDTRHHEVQLTFSGRTAYPYKVCHCFVILSAFLWHMKNILITPLFCHLSPGTINGQYKNIYISVLRDFYSKQTLH